MAQQQQERRPVGDVAKVGRVVRIEDGDEPGAGPLGELELLGDEGLGLLEPVEAAVQDGPGRRCRWGVLAHLAPA